MEATLAITFKEWSKKTQIFQVDKVNWEIQGPSFWKLDKVNYEAVQQNFVTDIMQIVLYHREEIMQLLCKHKDIIWDLQVHTIIIFNHVVPVVQLIDMKDQLEDAGEPSISWLISEEIDGDDESDYKWQSKNITIFLA